MSAQSVGKLGWELCAFSFGMVMRFLGRYPETARSYYKPPEDDHHHPCPRGLRHEHGIHSLLDVTYSHLHPQHIQPGDSKFPSERGEQKVVLHVSNSRLVWMEIRIDRTELPGNKIVKPHWVVRWTWATPHQSAKRSEISSNNLVLQSRVQCLDIETRGEFHIDQCKAERCKKEPCNAMRLLRRQ